MVTGVANRQAPTKPYTRRLMGVFPSASWCLPVRRAQSVWLLPRAAEPRQTVGNHASRAAYEWEQNQPSGQPGGVLRSPEQPPRAFANCFLLQRSKSLFFGARSCFSALLLLISSHS